ncbi:hypothetical protein G4L39_00615 [Limisphaera ngatamarikiensis]|uniref:LTD domain-containing protein n=1 Tax=Limisphaera ngatamarikiensis TaxID=1324935 RepID=A0A6M1RCV4_9BACT|nr:hypothetical protein [Limisphaera ngatamarikiensis]
MPAQSVWRFRAGTNEASSPITAWRQAAFDDVAAGFRNAPAPFWYGDPQTGGTQLTDMQGRYSCIFLRHPFVLSEVPPLQTVRLRAFVDDGFVAWINGQEVLRVRVPAGEPTINTLAQNAPEPVPWETYTLNLPPGLLRVGTNVLAVQVFNTSLGSSDLGFDAQLEAVLLDTNPPVLLAIVPAPGLLTVWDSIQVTFSEPVTGVDADDLLLNGVPALEVHGQGAVYTFRWTQPPYGTLHLSWSPNHGITDLAEPPLPFNANAPGAEWEYEFTDAIPPTVVRVHPPPGLTLRTLEEIEVTFSEPVWGVDAGDLRINGRPARSVSSSGENTYRFAFDAPGPATVTVDWAPNHGITDAAAASNAFAGGAWQYTLDPTMSTPPVWITEILAGAVRTNGLTDEDGDLQDWIELYNPGTEPVNLAGWTLSDDRSAPARWVFPERILPPNGYLVVFASGKDRRPTDPSRPLHTNFRLALGGEPLGLYPPGAPHNRVSGFDQYPEQRNDYSYGLAPDGQWRYYDRPTPGAPNGPSPIVGVCAPVHVNARRGHFDIPFDLILSCETPDVEFRYTTDGSEPTRDSPRFPGRLRIDRTTLFRAAAFKDGYLPSRTITHSYFFGLSPALRSLPTLSLVTASNHLYGPKGILGIEGGTYAGGPWQPVAPGDYHNPSQHGLAWERPVSVEWIEPADGRGFQADAGIRVHGSDYQRPRLRPTSKFSYRLYFRRDYGPGRLEYPLFPTTQVQRFDQLVLRAGFNEQDNPFVRDELTRRLSSDMGQIASHGTLAIVFLNGRPYTASPWYNPCERVHEEFFQEHLGGSAEWDVVGPPWAQAAGPSGVVDGDRTDFQALVNYVWTQSPAAPNVYSNIARWLDLTNFVDYLILNTWAATGDWPGNNWRAGRDRAGGPWRFVVWDAEWAMGFGGRAVTLNTFTMNGTGPWDSGLASTGSSEIAQLYQRLRLSGEFRLLWADRIHQHFSPGGALDLEHILTRLRELREQLAVLMPNFNPDLEAWIRQRTPIYLGQLQQQGLYHFTNAPGFNTPQAWVPRGFELVLTNQAGNIYYTTNGLDPRLPFTGAVAPWAILYTGPIRLTGDVTIRARSLVGTTWSAIAQRSFRVGPPDSPVRITELHYNPQGGSAEEFLELANIGTVAVDLSGCEFGGISFRFPAGSVLPPGARWVLASNTDTNAWLARYPGVTPFGWYGGNLANGGETIVLRDPKGRILAAVTYDDENGWPTEPDGHGPSLELIDPWANPWDPLNWQASTVSGGTPGQPPTTPPAPTIQIHELMADNAGAVPHANAFPDWIELHNAGPAPADISGWSLTDDNNPRKFVFPPGTTIAAGGFLIVWCNTPRTAPGELIAPFGLDREGDALFLYNAQTSRVDGVVFGLQVPNFALGRWQGRWTLVEPTPGAPNRPAILADPQMLALNEWMPGSGPDDPGWIELFNRSADLPVPLEGLSVAVDGLAARWWPRSYLAPSGHALLRLTTVPRPDRLLLRIPATGKLTLQDPAGRTLDEVEFASDQTGLSIGRVPDGGDACTTLAVPTPAASNQWLTLSGPRIHEILARNRSRNFQGRIADFIEIHNPTSTSLDLSGFRLTLQANERTPWTFAQGTILPPFGYLVVWCDPATPASHGPEFFNLGRPLPGESGTVYLWDTAGRRVDAVTYGFQVPDLSIGRTGETFTLLSEPTPGAANSSPATLGPPTSLRINEWMARPLRGPDWFEIYNTGTLPVSLEGLVITDDPSLAGRERHRIGPLSLIGPRDFVRFVADGDATAGPDHAAFALAETGEVLVLYRIHNNSWEVLDQVAFGAARPGVSQGRIPDGAPNFGEFTLTPTPGASNYRPLTNVVIHEVLAHTDPPREDAIELHNRSDQPVDISGWALSNDERDRWKYRFPPGTVIPPGGFLVVYEAQFNQPQAGNRAFALSSTRGEILWLTEIRNEQETGYRDRAVWGASFNGQAFGRVETSSGPDFAPLERPTFGVEQPVSLEQFRTGRGAPNAPPGIGPVVLSEIHYHPSGGPDDTDEWIELHNFGPSPVPLFDPAHPTNRWKLADAVSFTFPPGTVLPPGGFLIVTGFDPDADPTRAAALRSRFNIPNTVPLIGPFEGALDNAGETLTLLAPDRPEGSDSPQPGFVPYVRVDRVSYDDEPPWPTSADGSGHSLQKVEPWLFGNEPLHWAAGPPTPGRPNTAPATDSDADGIPDWFEWQHGLDRNNPADATLDSDGDGHSNREEYRAGTDPSDPDSRLELQLLHPAPPGRLRLRFTAQPHRSYAVLATEDLTSGHWQTIHQIPADPARRVVEIEPEPGTHGTRFYRLITPAPQP